LGDNKILMRDNKIMLPFFIMHRFQKHIEGPMA